MEEEVEEASYDDEEYEYEVSLSNDGKYTDVIHNQILSIMC